MTAQGHLVPGAIVSGVYRIVRPLSEGGMGAVFVAEHVTTRKPRALKIMHGELLADAHLRDRFIQEAQIGGRIESDHVVEVVDAGFDEALRVPWLAMELLEGEDLATKIARGPISPQETHELLGQLCHALDAGHSQGIVHRDLKPENIFVARAKRVGVSFTVKVLDFGIAKVVAEAKATRMATAAIGTPLWMAPEQTEASNRIVPATDVWALGLIAFRMLTARFYWHEAYRNEANVAAILTEMLVKPMPPASHRAAELGAGHLVPPGFDQWFENAVNRDPSRRYPTAGRAYAALSPLLSPGFAGPAVVTGRAPIMTEMGQYTPSPGISGTMIGGPPPPTAQPNVQTYVHGPSTPQQYAPPIHTPQQGVPRYEVPRYDVPQTPGAVAMAPAPPPARRNGKPSSSAARSFAIGLGSVLLLGVVAIVVVKIMGSSGTTPASGDTPTAGTDKADQVALNKWVKIEPPKKEWLLGLDADTGSPFVRGFRPSRKIGAPHVAFEIQQHEVTWGEIDPWLSTQKGMKPPKSEDIPGDASKRDKLPATGLPWPTAVAYCKSLGGTLPTEEQWELAARGPKRRKFAWGDQGIDTARTHAFAGKKATLVPVMTSDQDKTPGDDPLYDMMGNAQEYTLDVYQDDFADQDESWTQAGGVTFRGLRGLPLASPPDSELMATMSASHREPICATGLCATAKGTSDVATLIRTSFMAAPEGEPGPGRAQFLKLLGEAKSDLGACLSQATSDDGYLLKIDYSMPLKKVPLCLASDNYYDPIECCQGKKCEHAPHRLIKYDPVKATVTNPADPMLADSTGAAGTCGKAALDKKLTGVKWPEGTDDWIANVWVSRVESKPPKTAQYIGFRCARPVGKS